jgi:hypothetical protein
MPDKNAQFSSFVNQLLNEEGHPFQYAVLKHVRALYESQKSRWIDEVGEFPVFLRGDETHIDLVLKLVDAPVWLIVECKRVNPAYGNWCFFRTPPMRRDAESRNLLAEKIESAPSPATRRMRADGARVGYSADVYGLALEAKKSETQGNTRKQGREAFKDALAQVFRGLNGFVDFCCTDVAQRKTLNRRYFMPVIVTTANLWASDADLTLADLTTGRVEADRSLLLPKQSIIYQHHVSPSLKHTAPDTEFVGDSLGEVLDRRYVRTVLVTTALGLERGLSALATALDFVPDARDEFSVEVNQQ